MEAIRNGPSPRNGAKNDPVSDCEIEVAIIPPYSTAQNGSGVHARWIDGSVVIRAYIKRMGMGLNNMRESAAAPPFSCTHMTHLSRKRHALDHSAISSSTADGTAASFAAATSRAIRAAENGMYRASDSGLIHVIPTTQGSGILG